MDIALIRQRLVDAAAGITTLNRYADEPDSVTEPALFAADTDVQFDSTMGRGLDQVTVTLRLLVSRADDKAGPTNLAAYLAGSGAASIKAAVEADPTLAGACDTLQVVSVSAYRRYEHAGIVYLGAEWTVDIYGSGT